MPKASQLSFYHRYRRWVRSRRHGRKGRFLPPDPVRVPADIKVLEMLGQGKRTCTYRVQLDGRSAVLKVYRTAILRRYRWRFGVDLAQFEHDRNRAFWNNPVLRQYTVEPLRVLGVEDGYSPAFVQAWAEGESLLGYTARTGPIPADTLAAGYQIVRTAHAAGLYDLDLNAGNIKLRQTADGWMPLIYDFNLLPQHLYAPNPFRWLSLRLGLRHPGQRDHASLEGWANLGLTREQLHLG
jgi:hypothetical protein